MLTILHFSIFRNILKTTEVPLEQISKSRIKISMITLILSCALAAVSVGISSSLATLLATVYYFCKVWSLLFLVG